MHWSKRPADDAPLHPSASRAVQPGQDRQEPMTGVSNFQFLTEPNNNENDNSIVGMFNVDQNDSSIRAYVDLEDIMPWHHNLPSLVRAKYDSGPLPAEGLLLTSDKSCVQHIFNPSSYVVGAGSTQQVLLEPIPRNIVFVIDVSGSMGVGSKLRDAKAAFEAIIETLNEVDTFAIHTFSSLGTEQSKGPWLADSTNKRKAVEFVRNLTTRGSTNLYHAYINALNRAKKMQLNSVNDNGASSSPTVSVILLLTDGEATAGPSEDAKTIARAVRQTNLNVEAYIYAFAFGEGADLPLLSGISIQNGGISVPIFEGFGDSATQITEFYQGELGSILLSDVRIQLQTETDETVIAEKKVPVFPQGSEVVSRFLLSPTATSRDNNLRSSSTIDLLSEIKAVTTAYSKEGELQWVAQPSDISFSSTAENIVFDPTDVDSSYNCVQSLAHDKIIQLLRIRDGAMALGNDLWDYVVSDVGPRRTGVDLEAFAEALALEHALEAGLVWPDLTALVTKESATCFGRYEDVEVCYEGDGSEREYDEWMESTGSDSADYSTGYYASASLESASNASSFLLHVVGLVTLLCFFIL